MRLAGILLLVLAGIATHLSQRVQKPGTGVALWLLYICSLVVGIAMVTP